MKKLVVFFGVVLATIGPAVRAQEAESTAPMQESSWRDPKTSEMIDYMPEISLDTRLGYNHIFSERTGGFAGDGLYLDINGCITPNFSYSLNQRIASSYYEDNSGFNGTNWLTLTYEVGDFAFTAGKDALLVGSFEYDAYDLDSYYEMNSAFYNEFDCWQWGVSAAWYPAENHEVLLQFANSPFSYGVPDMYSLAAGWRGAWDWYESYWTINFWQYDASSVSKAFCAGNRFTFGGLAIDLDLMYRIRDFGNDYNSFTGTIAPSYQFNEWGRVFTKAGWESTPDTWFFGCGFEYFPLKENKNIRLHAAYTHNAYICRDIINIGLTWKMNLTNGIRKILGTKKD